MPTSVEERLIKQLDDVIVLKDQLAKKSKYDDLSDIKDWELRQLVTIARSGIERITGKSSIYSRQAAESMSAKTYFAAQVLMVVGVVESLRFDLKSGYLQTLQEIIHTDLFSDFMEMASHLLSEGYKDAAAVIGGSSLESHLRQLCIKNSISIEIQTSKGLRPKKADQINSELSSASVYSKLDQKNVTSWLDLRNKAAHGKYSDYTKDQVAIFLAGIQDFITRHPA